MAGRAHTGRIVLNDDILVSVWGYLLDHAAQLEACEAVCRRWRRCFLLKFWKEACGWYHVPEAERRKHVTAKGAFYSSVYHWAWREGLWAGFPHSDLRFHVPEFCIYDGYPIVGPQYHNALITYRLRQIANVQDARDAYLGGLFPDAPLQDLLAPPPPPVSEAAAASPTSPPAEESPPAAIPHNTLFAEDASAPPPAAPKPRLWAQQARFRMQTRALKSDLYEDTAVVLTQGGVEVFKSASEPPADGPPPAISPLITSLAPPAAPAHTPIPGAASPGAAPPPLHADAVALSDSLPGAQWAPVADEPVVVDAYEEDPAGMGCVGMLDTAGLPSSNLAVVHIHKGWAYALVKHPAGIQTWNTETLQKGTFIPLPGTYIWPSGSVDEYSTWRSQERFCFKDPSWYGVIVDDEGLAFVIDMQSSRACRIPCEDPAAPASFAHPHDEEEHTPQPPNIYAPFPNPSAPPRGVGATAGYTHHPCVHPVAPMQEEADQYYSDVGAPLGEDPSIVPGDDLDMVPANVRVCGPCVLLWGGKETLLGPDDDPDAKDGRAHLQLWRAKCTYNLNSKSRDLACVLQVKYDHILMAHTDAHRVYVMFHPFVTRAWRGRNNPRTFNQHVHKLVLDVWDAHGGGFVCRRVVHDEDRSPVPFITPDGFLHPSLVQILHGGPDTFMYYVSQVKEAHGSTPDDKEDALDIRQFSLVATPRQRAALVRRGAATAQQRWWRALAPERLHPARAVESPAPPPDGAWVIGVEVGPATDAAVRVVVDGVGEGKVAGEQTLFYRPRHNPGPMVVLVRERLLEGAARPASAVVEGFALSEPLRAPRGAGSPRSDTAPYAPRTGEATPDKEKEKEKENGAWMWLSAALAPNAPHESGAAETAAGAELPDCGAALASLQLIGALSGSDSSAWGALHAPPTRPDWALHAATDLPQDMSTGAFLKTVAPVVSTQLATYDYRKASDYEWAATAIHQCLEDIPDTLRAIRGAEHLGWAEHLDAGGHPTTPDGERLAAELRGAFYSIARGMCGSDISAMYVSLGVT
eukprot:TRINITY_DN19656_c1_g1_i3.p1 TRINITY_DN19656_c1_g1~~TRINITY_DN19656_c1_g1_i3.p1  ORF type:complete len:1033 (+),score=267.00 TRINITY_DN19656_c1_g1_i3:112-3210(+)